MQARERERGRKGGREREIFEFQMRPKIMLEKREPEGGHLLNAKKPLDWDETWLTN